MKHYYKILCLISISWFFMGCEKDNLDPLGNWSLTPAKLIIPTDNTSVELEEEAPNETVTFDWSPASSSADFAITYSVVFDTLGSTSFDTPILELPSGSAGKDHSLAISHRTIDEYLSYSGYPIDDFANITWTVKAKCLDRVVYASSRTISFKRFPTEIIPIKLYISGTATENNNDLNNAIALKRLNNSSGAPSNRHEVYTRLTAGNTYKFYSEKQLPCHQYGTNANGDLVKSGIPITVTESGEYRINVDLDNATYDVLKIEKWSVVGDPINNGWGGDEPLTYQGGGIWKASIQLVNTGNFAFRANENWGYLLKRVTGTTNRVIMESQATSQGLSYEDIPSTNLGHYFVTLNLSATGYTYNMEIDNTAPDPIVTPNQLFLFANGTMIEEFNKSGDVFSLDKFIPLQTSVNYSLNSESNGSGTSYAINGALGDSSTPDADKVIGNNTITESTNAITIANDRALRLTIDFSQSKVNWEYYNFKLFHWQVWENRDEFTMTYQHPNTYTITTALSTNYDMKFISPWDFDMGSTTPTALTGSITNGGGSNINNITSAGNYVVTITLDDDYQSGTYTFVQQ
ncbi:SusE domain-containing protein [Flavobacterium sp. J27]|uniref:SusE domain-containing protein n=1 Tax=Flavobacterium sp. J27 TaxID=2060419 RepID=UPI0010314F5B|nr:SusE domain-containing protein [Flavobacterium sp. J27]